MLERRRARRRGDCASLVRELLLVGIFAAGNCSGANSIGEVSVPSSYGVRPSRGFRPFYLRGAFLPCKDESPSLFWRRTLNCSASCASRLHFCLFTAWTLGLANRLRNSARVVLRTPHMFAIHITCSHMSVRFSANRSRSLAQNNPSPQSDSTKTEHTTRHKYNSNIGCAAWPEPKCPTGPPACRGAWRHGLSRPRGPTGAPSHRGIQQTYNFEQLNNTNNTYHIYNSSMSPLLPPGGVRGPWIKGGPRALRHPVSRARLRNRDVLPLWVALLVQRYLSNAASSVFYCIACPIRLTEVAALLATFEEHLR